MPTIIALDAIHANHNCKMARIKLYDGPAYILLAVRGEHDTDSHSPGKEKSKHLTVEQLQATDWCPYGAIAQCPNTSRQSHKLQSGEAKSILLNFTMCAHCADGLLNFELSLH